MLVLADVEDDAVNRLGKIVPSHCLPRSIPGIFIEILTYEKVELVQHAIVKLNGRTRTIISMVMGALVKGYCLIYPHAVFREVLLEDARQFLPRQAFLVVRQ